MSDENEGEKAVAAEPAPVHPAYASDLRAQAARMLEEATRIDRAVAAEELRRREERKPKQPVLGGAGDRAVVAFTKYQGGREYAYAAVGWRIGNVVRWTVTGQNTDRMNWPGLLQFIGEANWPSLHLMVESELLGPMPDDEAPVAERMGSYGRVLGTSSVVDPLVRAEVPPARGGSGGMAQYGRGVAFGIAALSPFEHRFGANEDGFGGQAY